MKQIAIGLLLSVVISGAPAEAAKCQRSCSQVKNTCIKMGASDAACSAGMSTCLQTGNLSMPSGRTFSNLCKK